MNNIFSFSGQVIFNDVSEIEARDMINEHITKVSTGLHIQKKDDYVTESFVMKDKTVHVEFAFEYENDKELDDMESLIFELE